MSGPDLSITITRDVVIFDGAARLYRYDRPSPAEIASYVRSVFGPDPGGAVVHVVAEEGDVDALDQALAGYDIVLTAERPREEPENPEDHTLAPAGEEVEITRPQPRVARTGSPWVLPAVVIAVVLVIGAAIWGTVALGADEPPAATTAPSSEQASPSVQAPPSAPAPARVVIVREGLSVEVPPGFSVAPDAEMWRATGPDPDFRLQLAVEELYQLPPEEMIAQVLRDIEADPEVELVSNDGSVVQYLQRSPDGSEAMWKTWAHSGRQLFVGCHTRTAPTTVQQATCRMAMDSASFDSSAADPPA
ncbi:type VII secretion-associated protein [Corynebacterium timonense]|uniref:Type VII secretion-associated protein, Rv3446c family, C-terminal domain-containing protein n=1 Tax=Corynebacterium timonense TaxID=441500 RepID=A0A1H1SK60_9CORY|nr:type VII secretion-associated protein [Corynebacterium timonense]SDS48218.1 type VII secretion-associated protein, Rv3446c family, C-terminal domain-containing protein [Corynebacterium timonense]